MNFLPSQERIAPFKIFGPLYFCGAHFGTSHLIDSGDGLILLDSGVERTAAWLIESIWELGFDPRRLRYIIHSHGHFDHTGATPILKRLSGATTFIGAGDENLVNGRLPLTWEEELGFSPNERFEADVIMHDGEIISLGNVQIRCVSTPGHTPGTMSFFFDLQENGQILRAGMHGGVGINSMEKKFLISRGLDTSCREQFLPGLEKLRHEHVDIFIGNHIWNNHLPEKYAKMQSGGPNPFINPEDWPRFLDECAAAYRDMLERECGNSGK